MERSREVGLVLLGLGNVGRALVRQVLQTRHTLERRARLRLVLLALADISGSVVDEAGLSDGVVSEVVERAEGGRQISSLPAARPLTDVDKVIRPGRTLADLTASSETAHTLRAALDAGCAVVLANKLPLAGTWGEAQPFLESPRVRYEVTVGAGLPVISTLQYLRDTGDEIRAVEGCLSGTLGYLCTELERGVPFSAAVRAAQSMGYTEPDPREDLSGRDVARKALILARTAGWPLEIEDLAVEALYPDELAGVSVDDFLDGARSQDEVYSRRLAAAADRGMTLRYVARVGPEGGSVGLASVPRASSMGALKGPENLIAIHTERYDDIPLVLAGPGAGPEVTAAGVLGDIIRLAHET